MISNDIICTKDINTDLCCCMARAPDMVGSQGTVGLRTTSGGRAGYSQHATPFRPVSPDPSLFTMPKSLHSPLSPVRPLPTCTLW